jgi:2-polyprenyl-3-methyl-5-hydroxy-6-metoxy-1,4-benzoquinol methylase
MHEAYTYEGNELELFRHAKNWKTYFSTIIKPFIGNEVLEVGAGIGATTLLLNEGKARSWILLEPDQEMAAVLEEKIKNRSLPANSSVFRGTIEKIQQLFDTIIYIDVLEHIETDKLELEHASKKLRPGGHLIVLSPAFQSLYNPFDRAIGHYRRYNKKMLRAISPAGVSLVKSGYYDSVGFFAASANKILLRKKYPTQKQVLLWDRWMVPVSKLTDKLFFHSFGKSIIAVWKKS